MKSILFLLLSCLCLAADPNTTEPNSMKKLHNFVSGWLSPGEPIGKMMEVESWVIPPNTVTSHAWAQKMDDGTFLIIRAESPNYLKFTVTRHRPVNYVDFVDHLSKKWPGDPNFVQPVDPNLPADPCEPNIPQEPNLSEILEGVTDPNLINMIKGIMK